MTAAALEKRIERLSQMIAGSKYEVERHLRAVDRYATSPVSDLVNDAAPIIAAHVLECLRLSSEASVLSETDERRAAVEGFVRLFPNSPGKVDAHMAEWERKHARSGVRR